MYRCGSSAKGSAALNKVSPNTILLISEYKPALIFP
jgi:hypothetical protein